MKIHGGAAKMTFQEHARRIGCLLMAVSALLVWRVSSAEVLSADGLRYTAQAKRITAGDWSGGLVGSVDHPMYPLQIAAMRSLAGLPETPRGWQNAAWAASLVHGVLLVIPLYLVARRLFGDQQAWLGVVSFYAVPLTSQILADALSESTFLHFWCWSLWFALEFLVRGRPGWLACVAVAGALAYWTRPEGMLICLTLGLTILITPILPRTRIDWPKFGRVLAMLAVATAIFSVPLVLSRGSIGTKPAIAKVLGLKSRAGAHAVERERPLDPNQTELETWAMATKAYFKATKQAVTTPGLILAAVGLVFWRWPNAASARQGLLMVLIMLASAAALIRLHATQGYCAPRHTMVPSQFLLMAVGSGLYWLGEAIMRQLSRLRHLPAGSTLEPGPAVWVAFAMIWGLLHTPDFIKPIGNDALGYRQAAEFIGPKLQPGEPLADLTGWTPFYADHPGYTFASINNAFSDPNLRYVVVREAHLIGPWDYCQTMKKLTSGATRVAEFPPLTAGSKKRVSRVIVFEKPTKIAANR